MGAALPWIARYEDYANCKKNIAKGYGNIPCSTTRLLSLLQLTGDNQFYGQMTRDGNGADCKSVGSAMQVSSTWLPKSAGNARY